MIPPSAQALAAIRVDRVVDVDGVEQTLRERIKTKRLRETEVTLDFERRRLPLQATAGSRALSTHAVSVYAEIGQMLHPRDRPTSVSTDAAFAAPATKAPVIECCGQHGLGAHSTYAEYILMPSIVPRL